jgi:hypothetical protein
MRHEVSALKKSAEEVKTKAETSAQLSVAASGSSFWKWR